MLPLPGSPAASWVCFKARLRSLLQEPKVRVCVAFWLFGVINNVLYVIILSAALDLVGPRVPKAVVLLADVLPSLFVKLIAPYFIHVVPYSSRIMFLVCLSMVGMFLVALTPETKDGGTIATKMAGVVLASLASGGGELSFLSLTHYYGHASLASWGSGTGGAGLIGAGAYVVATTWIGLSVKTSLVFFSFLPVIMLLSFFLILPRGPILGQSKSGAYEAVPTEATAFSSTLAEGERVDADSEPGREPDDSHLLGLSIHSETPLRSSFTSTSHVVGSSQATNVWRSFRTNLRRTSHLFFPYMLPLLLVYSAEYTINQGVAPTLLFPLPSTPFSHYRAFYPTYNAIYQTGVFLSRSSSPFFRIHNLYLPSWLQVLNLALLVAHALYDFLPNVYCVFAVVFWEGLLGGLVYVNTFAEISDRVRVEDREFSLGATSVSDSAGICFAGFVGMALEVWLCDWQVQRGRDYCRKL